METKNNLKTPFLILILALNLFVDQVSKIIVRKELQYNEPINLIKDRFTLIKVENTGAFLSLGDDLPNILKIILLNGLPLVVLGYGLYYLFSKRSLATHMQLALCFLIGGGAGNLYDRMLYGSVTDFMHMDFYLFQTGIFNFGDISIMIGIGILLFQSVLIKKEEPTIEEDTTK
ncbi:signal peptidase II [Pedobacter sp. MW01-1-1]|uniref:signal peptidase II n=1 Tax=Pedobacter sp. MW01-1-1 TaxID=3383027 RepID=UPI003FF1411A